MKKKDRLIIFTALIAAGLLFAFSYPGFRASTASNGAEQASGPASTPAAEGAAEAADEQAEPANAYLRVIVDTYEYAPVPLTGEEDITIKQDNGHENVIRVTADSIQMLSANCDNQDCVHQGIVTLENRSSRALWGYIICLPNRVQLELLTRGEAYAALGDLNGQ